MLEDPALEARARDLGKDLRCVVCQNQSIDDSNAELAQDMRALVRERLVAGDSDQEVKAYLVQRYGDFVLLEPPFNLATALLWGGPFAVMAAGGLLIAAQVRRRRGALPQGEDAGTPELTPAERRALNDLLNESEKDARA